MTAADPTAAIAYYLRDQPSIVALLAGDASRIFRPELPQSQTSSMPQACIVVRTAGGYGMFGRSNLPVGDPRLDMLCYGSTRLEADSIAREVLLALKALGHPRPVTYGSTVLKWARISAGPLPMVQGTTGPLWPFTLVSAQVMHAEAAVA